METESKKEPSSVRIEEESNNNSLGQLKALIIGVNRYLESNPLSYCVNDAKSIAEILSNSKYSLCDKRNIRLMTDDSGELDRPIRSNILNNISSLSKAAQPVDTVLFFFAGHGDEIENEAFIMPSDFRHEAGKKAGISIDDIKQDLVNSNARFKILLFDACHSGSVKDRAETGKMSQVFYNSLFPDTEGFAVVSACSQDENSHEWPREEHGVFTYYLLQGLEGQADKNLDGFVNLNELYSFITPKVQEWAFQNGTVQTPVIKANFKGLLLLTKATDVKTEKPAPVIESNVNFVELVTETETMKQNEYEMGLEKATENLFDEHMERISADLLEFFKPSDMGEKNDTISFPNGYIQLEEVTDDMLNVHEMRIRLHLESKGNSDLIEKILFKLDDYRDFWNGIGFEFAKCVYDMDKLKAICENKGFEREKFKIKPPQTLTVTVRNWLSRPLHTTFVDGENAFAAINANTTLPQDFYSILNPKNILEVFGSALITK